MMRRTLAAGLFVLLTTGCAAVEYSPDAKRATYLAGKNSTYALWRCGALEIEALSRARRPLEALYEALSADGRVEADGRLVGILFAEIDSMADAAEAALLKELVAAALDDFNVRLDAGAAGPLVIGGILDGIAHAEAAAAGVL